MLLLNLIHGIGILIRIFKHLLSSMPDIPLKGMKIADSREHLGSCSKLIQPTLGFKLIMPLKSARIPWRNSRRS